jgi:hypothetical protein
MEDSPAKLPEVINEEPKGMLDALLDFSFKTPITPKIMPALYIVGLVLSALAAFSTVFSGKSIMGSLLALVFAPVVFVIYALITRVALELVQTIFKIAEHLKNLDKKSGL